MPHLLGKGQSVASADGRVRNTQPVHGLLTPTLSLANLFEILQKGLHLRTGRGCGVRECVCVRARMRVLSNSSPALTTVAEAPRRRPALELWP